MRRFLFVLSVSCSLVACKHPDKQLKQTAAAADSIAINYIDRKTDSTVKVAIVRDKQTIAQLADLISIDRMHPDTACLHKGYDGSIHIFKNDNVVQNIYFASTIGDCNFFFFEENLTPVATVFTDQAKQLLDSLQK